MVKITGVQDHVERLQRLSSPKAKAILTKALFAAGQLIEIDAEISITTGSVSGKGHVASAPGQPPNADTRDLDTKIETVVVPGDTPRVNVEAYSDHALPLEFGTSKMAERPFMRPAVKKNRQAVTELVAKGVNIANAVNAAHIFQTGDF